MRYWLIKSEPSEYSLADLAADGTELWDGVRNYQARNFLQQMEKGDRLFFYHSNTKPPGIVGLARVTQANLVDPSQFNPESKYFDPKATPEKPRWYTVEVGYQETFAEIITLNQLKASFTPEEFAVVRRGNRLSVMPVPETVAERLLAMVS
ncbi:EVE domain-containing protein [Synechococcus sp. BDU 130192]|uniref:EVE domain-containing protein n=1 Tax=Synechococcus sp. BDU 130192 TaxID=2042059 RepID=UPI000C08007C|nr:EVE domain-containing protein [Synechococcus sp. BDU 130192]